MTNDLLKEYRAAQEEIKSFNDDIHKLEELREAAQDNADAAFMQMVVDHLVVCSCGSGEWPCNESTLPGMNTLFHHVEFLGDNDG